MQADLNLLVVLDALLEEGSVMGAAERLHLSSPAVSRTLGRIRKVTGDDILVRTGHTMTPTPYALGIAEEVRRLVREANAVLTPSRELDLAELERTFTVRCHDALASSVVPTLVGRIASEAPGVRLRVLAEHSGDTDDLRHGRVDLELGGGAPDLPEFRSEVMGTDPLAVVLRRGHPCTELDLRAYAAYPHVLVSRRGRFSAPIDEVLEREGLRRKVIATVATVHSALQIAAAGDALVTTTTILCRPLIEAFGLVTLPLPVESPEAPIHCNWHQRYDSDRAHEWLRSQVRETLGEVLAR
ncbi:LysR family transcriptional regulator [Lentzea sp. NPDC058450]|uniref:LysR family transcriptional regulator n=1 Tax=Lentzea sp. NPDC058450 TaxID=3346505 RepID=UPI00364A295F